MVTETTPQQNADAFVADLAESFLGSYADKVLAKAGLSPDLLERGLWLPAIVRAQKAWLLDQDICSDRYCQELCLQEKP